MSVTAVVGCQWGDEAKGKFVDYLSSGADIVARYNGGDNAGHTVVNQYGTAKLRLLPNGLFNTGTTCVVGPGVVVNLATLIEEIDFFERSGVDYQQRLWISPRCNVVMPYHPLVEEIYEKARGQSRTGTTRRGMGPVHADRASYNGIRLYDLADEATFAERLRLQLAIKNPTFEAFGMPALDFETVFREKLAQYARVAGFVREPYPLVNAVLKRKGTILLEGAQGALLDNTWGTYPYCTASTTLSGGAAAGLGIPPYYISRVVGIAKAYTTRVGAGPMPTELHDQDGQTLQQEGQEFGTVTGRARRCGWFDAEIVRFTCQLNGVTDLALTKLDVLDTFPTIKICTGYRHSSAPGRLSHYWEGDAAWLEDCQPEYIEMDGWQSSTRHAASFDQLPVQAQHYVRQIEQLVEAPLRWISVGPGRSETIAL